MKKFILFAFLCIAVSVFSQTEEEDYYGDPTDEEAPDLDPDVDEDTIDYLLNLAGDESTSGYDINEETILYLIENGISPYIIEQYLNGVSEPYIDDIIEGLLYDYERALADEIFTDMTDGDGEFDFDLLDHLNPEDMAAATQSMEDLIAYYSQGDPNALNLDATKIKEGFLQFINSNKNYLITNAEYIIVFNLILDLVNNDLNVLELLRVAGLPTESILGNPITRIYDRHMTSHLENFRETISLSKLDNLGTGFDNAVRDNFDPDLADMILNGY